MSYQQMTKAQLSQEKQQLTRQYEGYKAQKLSLNMARGKPGEKQLDLSVDMLEILNHSSDFAVDGFDVRNYGLMDGISDAKKLFGDLLGAEPECVMVGGNSSLNMMFDTISCMMTTQIVEGCVPWYEVKNRKFLCPVPGYDRHFSVTEYFGFEMINIQMTPDGPDMDMIEKLVSEDDSIKGIWCVPKYSNPQGITYSDETVRRFAALKPAAKDFRIMWDNAYCVHDITDTPDSLLDIMQECKKAGNPDLPICFCSTSKISFPGAGVAAMASSPANMKVFKERYKWQTIGYDKLNMYRHILYFKDVKGIEKHMQKHRAILEPKFKMVISKLHQYLDEPAFADWTEPNGGYFISVDVLNGTAERVVALCKEAGVVLTGAGATYPYGKDPNDSNIRIAPTYPAPSDLEKAMDIFCTCAKLAAVEKLLEAD